MARLRKRAGLTMAGLARECGVLPRTVMRWEAGDNPPSAGGFERFAMAACLSRRERDDLWAMVFPNGGPRPTRWDRRPLTEAASRL